jgi:hypothetical protein
LRISPSPVGAARHCEVKENRTAINFIEPMLHA